MSNVQPSALHPKPLLRFGTETEAPMPIGRPSRQRPWPAGPEAYASDGQGFPPDSKAPAALDGNPVVPVAKTRAGSDGAENAVQLVIGARAAAPGVARARGVDIRYRIGHRRYRRSTNASMYLCAPSERFTAEKSCPGEAEGRFADVVVAYPAVR